MGHRFSRESFSHRAIHSRNDCILVITNKTPFKIKVYWHNYVGQRLLYFTLSPGSFYHQPTFTTHPWSFEIDQPADPAVTEQPLYLITAGPRHQTVVYPSGQPLEHVDIEVAKKLVWSPETHAKWFSSYSPIVQTVIKGAKARYAIVQDNDKRCGSALSMYDSVSSLEVYENKWNGMGVANGRRKQAGDKTSSASVASSSSSKRSFSETLSTESAFAEEQNRCYLPDIPEALLLSILTMAAPVMYDIVKPQLPTGAAMDDYVWDERMELFDTSPTAST